MRTMLFFFFNDTATTEIYTLSLHDALPISGERLHPRLSRSRPGQAGRIETLSVLPRTRPALVHTDRKSTRLNSSHLVISYAVFCLKKKKTEHSCALAHDRSTAHVATKLTFH